MKKYKIEIVVKSEEEKNVTDYCQYISSREHKGIRILTINARDMSKYSFIRKLINKLLPN